MDCHSGGAGGVSPDRCIDQTFLLSNRSLNYSQVELADPLLGKLDLERFKSTRSLSHNDHTACFLVQSMYDPRASRIISRRKVPTHKKSLHKGRAAPAGSRMNDQIHRLVHNDDLLILVQNRQVNPRRRKQRLDHYFQ